MDKLDKILKLRTQQEQDQAGNLSQARAARSEAEQQQQQLAELTLDYREKFSLLESTNVHQLKQFQLFYTQLNKAVIAQGRMVDTLICDEEQQHDIFVTRHKDRRSLERLLEQRDTHHKTKSLRSERRAAIRPQSKPLV